MRFESCKVDLERSIAFEDLGGQRRATYLLAIAVGPYDVVDYGMIPANSTRDREIPLRGIAAHGQCKNIAYALNNTDGILSVLE